MFQAKHICESVWAATEEYLARRSSTELQDIVNQTMIQNAVPYAVEWLGQLDLHHSAASLLMGEFNDGKVSMVGIIDMLLAAPKSLILAEVKHVATIGVKGAVAYEILHHSTTVKVRLVAKPTEFKLCDDQIVIQLGSEKHRYPIGLLPKLGLLG